jgi:hypothetical protein
MACSQDHMVLADVEVEDVWLGNLYLHSNHIVWSQRIWEL